MAESSWPFHDGVDGTPVLEDQWSYMARQWAATGVVGAPGDANLQVFANGSGMEVHVRSGRASVRGHWFLSDAQETLAIAANSSGNPRIDRVVVQLDPSSNEATLAVLTGTPGTVPTAPSLTQTDTGVYELTLAQVAVANGAASISALNVTDERTFSSVPYTVALSSMRPAAPVVGQGIYETDTGRDKVWNGSAWVNRKADPAEAWTLVTPASGWQHTIVDAYKMRYWREGDVVRLKGCLEKVGDITTAPMPAKLINASGLPAPGADRQFPVLQYGAGAPNIAPAWVSNDGSLWVYFQSNGSPTVYVDSVFYVV